MLPGCHHHQTAPSIPSTGWIWVRSWSPTRSRCCSPRRTPYLDGEELGDERQENHLLAVPHLLAVHLDAPPQLPPLPPVLHEDLGKEQRHGDGGTGTQDKAHPRPPGTARTAGREGSRSPSISPEPHAPRTGHQHRAGRNLPALQEKAEGHQDKMCRHRAGAVEGRVTFHPDVELAQLALQLALQQAHVLGTRDRAPVTHSPRCRHPPSPPSAAA